MQAGAESDTSRAARGAVACPACDGVRRRARFEALPWVVTCEGCGLTFADPQPTDEALAAIYDEHYYEQFGFVESPDVSDAALARTKMATYGAVLDVALPHLAARGHRLLDVGCGLGFSLLAAKARGFDALGLDPLAPEDPAARPGRTIRRGDLASFAPDAPFDVISMIDVIEHVRDPVRTLRTAASHLAPGGLVVLATNDSGSLGARLLGPRWTHFHRAHLWFFTPASLADVARRAGLEVLATAPARRTYNLEYIASILARGTNFEAAARLSRVALRVTPERVRRAAWPPVSEGFVLVARPAGPRP